MSVGLDSVVRGALPIVLVLAPLAAACGGDDGGGDARAGRDGGSSTTREEPAASASPSDATTAVPAQGPEQWVTVVREVQQRWYEVLQDPDPATVDEVYVRTCECWTMKFDTVQRLASQGWHAEGQPTDVLAVREESLDERDNVSTVTLTTQVRQRHLRVLDGDGQTVDEFFSDEPVSCVSLGLRSDADAPYRITHELPLADCPDGWE